MSPDNFSNSNIHKYQDMQLNFDQNENAIIKVIGVGGGGSNAVAYMYNQGIKGVDFAVCNTDSQALNANPVPNHIQLGPSLTQGNGAGSVPEVGKQSCIESIDDVRLFLEKGTKMLFVTAGMGGGTGTGAAPIIAKAAREMGILTVGIVTLPFSFEGRRRHRHALEGLEQMKNNVDAILVISNDKLRDMFGNLKIQEAFSKADDVLTTAAKGIAEIITLPGIINVDFEDVNTVMRASGVAIMGTGLASGDDRAKKAIDLAINSPLLEDNDIRGAEHILLNISSGVEEITMDEIGIITDFIQEEAGHGTDLIWGHCHDDSLGDKVSLTIIATGFKKGNTLVENVVAPPKKVALDEPYDLQDDDPTGVLTKSKEEIKKYSEYTDYKNKNVSLSKNEGITSDKFLSNDDPFIKREKEEKQQFQTEDNKEDARRQYLRRLVTKPLEDPKTIADMESQPAYLRRNVELDKIGSSNQRSNLSRLNVSVDDNSQPIIERSNSFLHDNVD